MATKLRKVSDTLLRNESGLSSLQVPAASLSGAVKVYKQGATVTTAGPTTIAGGGGTTVSVRDAGRFVVGDTVQKGTSASATATVSAIVSRTSITLVAATGTLVVSVGDRLVVTTNRPTCYSESTGTVSLASPNIDTDANGRWEFYSDEGVVDIIFSDASITSKAAYDIEAGYVQTVTDIQFYRDLQAAHDSLPASGGGLYLPDGYVCNVSSVVTISKPNVRLFSDSWGTATIQAAAADPNYILIKVEGDGFVCENIRFDQRATVADVYDLMQINGQGVINSGTQPVTFRNCYFLNWTRNAMRITGGVFAFECQTSWFGGGFGPAVYCQGSSVASDPATPYSDDVPTHLAWSDCEFTGIVTGSTEAALYFATCGPITIRRCQIEGIKGGTDIGSANGIHCDSVYQLRIEKCHFEPHTSGTYKPSTNPEQLIVLSGCQGAHISDCEVIGSADTSIQAKRWLSLGNSSHAIIVGGRISNLKSGTKLGVYADSNSNYGVRIGGVYETSETDSLQPSWIVLHGYNGMHVGVVTDNTDRGARISTVDGTLIYNAAAGKFQGRAGGSWVDLN